MKNLLLLLVLLSLAIKPSWAGDKPTSDPKDDDWKALLNETVDHWLPIDGTISEQFLSLQEIVQKQHGQVLPIFVPPVPPHLPAETVNPQIKNDFDHGKSGTTRTAVTLSNVPIKDVIRYICSLAQCESIETKVGIVIRPIRN